MALTKANVAYPEVIAWLNQLHLPEVDALVGSGGSVFITPQQYGAFGDGASHPIDADDITDHPEWWGTYSVGDEWDAVGIQEMIYNNWGGPDNGTNPFKRLAGTMEDIKKVFIQGEFLINRDIDASHMISFFWEGASKLGAVLFATDDVQLIQADSISYGVFASICFATSATGTKALVDLDYVDGNGVGDLRPQNITFYDCVFNGNNAGYIGVQISKSGGGAQGDNIRFYNCYGFSFTQAAAQLGGGADGTATAFAFNCIDVKWIGGDIQNCPKYGLSAYGANWIVENTSFENSTSGAAEQTGFDILCVSAQLPASAKNCRSESTRFSSGVAILENVAVNPQVHSWYNSNGGGSLAGTAVALNQAISGTSIGGDGKLYKVTTAGTLGGLGLTTAASATSNTLTVAGTPWTVNAFTGYKVSIISGTGAPTGLTGSVSDGEAAQSFEIASNTNNTLTLVGSWTITPDATSQFVIEPNWGTQTTSGTVVFALVDYFVAVQVSRVTGCKLVGGKISLSENGAAVDGLAISRRDAFGVTGSTNGPYDNFYSFTRISNTFLIGGVQNGLGPNINRKWFIPSHGGDIGSSLLKDYSQFNLGAQKIVWSGSGSPSDANNRFADLWIGRGDGIRGDSGGATGISRNVLELRGTWGRAPASGTNQTGGDIYIQPGLGTGTGTSGTGHLRAGAAGSSGSSINNSADVFIWDSVGTTTTGSAKHLGFQGSYWKHGTASEQITLSTGGTTTDSTLDMLPANSIIDAVVATIAISITTATSVQIGDPTTADRFISGFPAMGAGNKAVGIRQHRGSVTTDAAGPTQAAAAKIRITTDVNPGAGAILLIVFYRQFVAPDI